ncbi:uncharacterized protein LOC141631289 [Silene latifolia]|uniref:uncharacterized protein LOC141631289 n=1 Tax=Silene latifolia TaxID=37657 RepID=UPI003D770F89
MVVTSTGSLKEACMCKGFRSTLSGAALQWFASLPKMFISTFADFINAFNQQFASNRKPEKQTSDLYRIVQRFKESTRDYLNRFNIEKVFIPKCDISTAVEAFSCGLHHDSDLYRELTKYPCTTFEEVQQKAVGVMHLEEHEGSCLDHLLPKGAKSGKVNTAEQVLPSPPPLYSKVVNLITRGSEICGLTYSSAKRHAIETKGHKPESSCRISRRDLPAAAFDETDIQDEGEQHHDALIITLSIGHSLRERPAQEGGTPGLVQWRNETLSGEIVIPTFIRGVNKEVRYLAIDGPSTYNVILGRPWIHEIKAVPSTYHQSLKLPTPWGVQEIRGDQEEARDCYKDALKPTAIPPA